MERQRGDEAKARPSCSQVHRSRACANTKHSCALSPHYCRRSRVSRTLLALLPSPLTRRRSRPPVGRYTIVPTLPSENIHSASLLLLFPFHFFSLQNENIFFFFSLSSRLFYSFRYIFETFCSFFLQFLTPFFVFYYLSRGKRRGKNIIINNVRM